MGRSNNTKILHNCIIVTEDKILTEHALVIKSGIIDEIIHQSNISLFDGTKIDCEGCYVLPGIIDIHSDVIEKIIVPRKSIVFDNNIALNEIDRELMLQGITTIYHSISIAESTICDNERTLKINNMFDLCDVINSNRNKLLINHKFHARYELNSINSFEILYKYLCLGRIDELSFMDHTPGQGQYKNLDEFKKIIHQQYGCVSKEREKEIIDICINKPKISSEQIKLLIDKSNELQVPMAYHDVESFEQIDYMKLNNIMICEFPLKENIAEYAIKNGLTVIVGAPNILLGRSHYNNANAASLLQNHKANVICSDYFSASLLPSVFKLTNTYKIPLYESVKYVSLNPARALNVDSKLGSIKKGKIADLIVVEKCDGLIVKVKKTIVNGNIIFEIKDRGI